MLGYLDFLHNVYNKVMIKTTSPTVVAYTLKCRAVGIKFLPVYQCCLQIGYMKYQISNSLQLLL